MTPDITKGVVIVCAVLSLTMWGYRNQAFKPGETKQGAFRRMFVPSEGGYQYSIPSIRV